MRRAASSLNAMSTTVPAPPSRARRWRPWLLLFGIGLAWKVLVLTVGAAVPRWVIGDGVAHLPEGVRPYAVVAQARASTLWNKPIERLGLVQALRVVRVDTVSESGGGRPGAATCGGLRATVRAYTYFAIPYGQAYTVCDSGVVEYRAFRKSR